MADARRPAGFTLIEVMVALAVFALAALALIRLEGAGLRGAAAIRETLAATTLADALAVEAASDARPPTIGDDGGQAVDGGLAWRWRRHVESTADPRVLRIDVAVATAAGVVRGAATRVRLSPLDGATSGGNAGAGTGSAGTGAAR